MSSQSYRPTSANLAICAKPTAGYLQLAPLGTPVAAAPLCLASQQIVGTFALRRTGCPEQYDVLCPSPACYVGCKFDCPSTPFDCLFTAHPAPASPCICFEPE
ncbi:uncharacterized protein SETTUDRAFT_164273 [Exserohilum turcica Et28A]|uniref:Uncharacterized protein n=1 Tax=Exserohilum turcicum (strain 28A) TaxID=671987 RepID=R0K6E5_EXST2|nr:uncharacterized protein SETTUDRAFT_164273 [Exserohilum turcica Et28A]EOA83902.1 hypothetical protein SETTUDRAFT_164273 [Exserohilum turcica Et28A]